MSSVMSFSFNAVELCVVMINEKTWTHVREVCRALEYDAKTSKTANMIKPHVSPENITKMYQMNSYMEDAHQSIGQKIRKNTVFML